MIDLRCGDALRVLTTLPAASADCIVTDPPYGLRFLGKDWDHGIPSVPYWKAALDVLKPSGYMFAFGGTRTFHRLTCAIEDAGFEIRDCVMWLYAQGFPKGRSCLKPAYEPITLARKKGSKVRHLNIDDCRIPIADDDEILNKSFYVISDSNSRLSSYSGGLGKQTLNPDHHPKSVRHHIKGRWPPNVAHDGSDEVMGAFAEFGIKTTHMQNPIRRNSSRPDHLFQQFVGNIGQVRPDSGSIARFFYCAKARRSARSGISHPTVKPTDLVRWLIRLIAKPGDLVLDPFCGSGSTGVAARQEGCRFLGIDIDPVYVDLARRRIADDAGPLFALPLQQITKPA